MGDRPPREGDEPSLELPSLELPSPFRRRRRPAGRRPAADVPPPPLNVRELRLPVVAGRVAAAVTGVVVGLLGAVLTWAGLRTCEQLRGTDSCGGAGIPLLVLILLGMVLAGGVLLAAWDVADPRSTSALGVGIVCVLVLLVLSDQIAERRMFVVVPLLSGLAYLCAHWVATAVTDQDTHP